MNKIDKLSEYYQQKEFPNADNAEEIKKVFKDGMLHAVFAFTKECRGEYSISKKETSSLHKTIDYEKMIKDRLADEIAYRLKKENMIIYTKEERGDIILIRAQFIVFDTNLFNEAIKKTVIDKCYVRP